MPETTGRPTYLNAADLDAFLATHDITLVEFYTEGCSMCAAMEPVLGNVARALANEYADAVVALTNPRDHAPLVDRFDVRSVPKLLLFRDGRLAASREGGFLGAEDVLEFVQENV